MSTSLSLAGASDEGVAVIQGLSQTDSWKRGNALVLTGVEGDVLTPRPSIQSFGDFHERPLLGVAGNQLGWAAATSWFGETSAWRLHRTNILTGEDVVDATTAQPTAFTGDSWYTWHSLLRYTYNLPDETHFPLYRHLAGTGVGGENGEMEIYRLLAEGEGTADLAADGSSVLVALADPPLPEPFESDPDGVTRTFALKLIDLGTGQAETLLETSDTITSVALGPDVIAWDSQAPGQPRKINSRPREEGATTHYTETDPRDVDLVAGTAGVGYLLSDPVPEGSEERPPDQPTQLRIVTGETARTVALPDGSSGLAAVGDRFLTAAGGSDKAAGVYSVSPGDRAIRTATVPTANRPVKDFALAGSALYYADDEPGDGVHRSVWKAAVSGTPTLQIAKAKKFPVSAGPVAEQPVMNGQEIFFSAGRGLVVGPDDPRQWQLVDRGKVTAVVGTVNDYIWELHPAVSGPYAVVDNQVFRPNGDVAYQIPDVEFKAGDRALFGSTLVYSLEASFHQETGTYDSEIWVDDIENPEPQQLDVQLNCGVGAPPVAVWGQTVAWGSCDQSTIAVRDLGTGQQRTVSVADGAVYAGLDIALGEGVLFWSTRPGQTAGNGGHLLDLRTPGSEPVALPGIWDDAVLDDHLIAHGYGDRGEVEVQRLPFTQPNRPRLIGTVASAGFTPGGEALWRPRFDVSKPLTRVKLTVTGASGQTVRTLTGTSPDGSIRDLAWDGRDRQGRLQPAGSYRWTLTAGAADGEGAIMGKNGGNVVTGQVRIRN
ncbi:FlgD immunoglobulin-like domain containing protein [Kineosporia sp. NBRC 101731]|uniref:FlgD immunoglobulin-like domain containing protein n=1 Tax=Kineosporia sp. NBRC 101731 TaxID=3032199 RepID=UPI002556F234|nr:FlgD immunoglobulin-like domain containing protein [Kineosporia sp. NBRC 101731]